MFATRAKSSGGGRFAGLLRRRSSVRIRRRLIIRTGSKRESRQRGNGECNKAISHALKRAMLPGTFPAELMN